MPPLPPLERPGHHLFQTAGTEAYRAFHLSPSGGPGGRARLGGAARAPVAFPPTPARQRHRTSHGGNHVAAGAPAHLFGLVTVPAVSSSSNQEASALTRARQTNGPSDIGCQR